jgi:hypothetical protein
MRQAAGWARVSEEGDMAERSTTLETGSQSIASWLAAELASSPDVVRPDSVFYTVRVWLKRQR